MSQLTNSTSVSAINQIDAQNFCFTISLLHASTCFEHMCLWYHHTYRCDDTRGCVMQFWPPDDEHTCSKHVEAWNKLIVKQKFCASIWLITEINILRCTVSRTSKNGTRSIDTIWRSITSYAHTDNIHHLYFTKIKVKCFWKLEMCWRNA